MSITLEIPEEVEAQLEAMSPQERKHLLAQALTGHFSMVEILSRRAPSDSRLKKAREMAAQMKRSNVSRDEAFDSLRDLLTRINS